MISFKNLHYAIFGIRIVPKAMFSLNVFKRMCRVHKVHHVFLYVGIRFNLLLSFQAHEEKNRQDVKNQIIIHIDVIDYCCFACYSFCKKSLSVWTIMLRRARVICSTITKGRRFVKTIHSLSCVKLSKKIKNED